tara:strand:- start:906 stop:1265 length:360 start_codon:yes stop_codon:yes gene_type:complete
MATKISVSIDADKARELLSNRSYKDKSGKEVAIKEIKFDLVEMKQESQKVVYDAEKFQLVKTHFAVKQQTKEERENKTDVLYVGEGVSQVWKNEAGSARPQTSFQAAPQAAIEADDLPF